MEDNAPTSNDIDSTGCYQPQFSQSISDRSKDNEDITTQNEENKQDNCEQAKPEEKRGQQPAQQQQEDIRQPNTKSKEQKQEIQTFKHYQPKAEQRQRILKQVEYLRVRVTALEDQLKISEQTSQQAMTDKQLITQQLQQKIRQYKQMANDLQEMKINNEKAIGRMISYLKQAIQSKREKISEQKKVKSDRKKIIKEEQQRLKSQKITQQSQLEAKLEAMKKQHQKLLSDVGQTIQLQQKDYEELQAQYSQLQQLNTRQRQLLEKMRGELDLKERQIQDLRNQLELKKTVEDDLQRVYLLLNESQEFIQQLEQKIQGHQSLNSQLEQKCIKILSQPNDSIFLRFREQISSFSTLLQKSNFENKYLKDQIIKMNERQLVNQKEIMNKEMELTYALQKISLLQFAITEKEEHMRSIIQSIQNICKMKNEEIESLKNNIQQLERIIEENTVFYDKFIADKQIQWSVVQKLNEEKMQRLIHKIQLLQQEQKSQSNEIQDIKISNQQENRKLKRQYQQQLSKAEKRVFQIQEDINQLKSKLKIQSEEKERLLKQCSLTNTLIELIEKSDDNVQALIVEIDKINQDHVFDKIFAVFLSINDKLASQERKITNLCQKLKKIEAELLQIEKQRESDNKRIVDYSSQLREKQSSLDDKDKQLLSLSNQLKQKEENVQQLLERMKQQQVKNASLLSYKSEIDSCWRQIERYRQQNTKLQNEKQQLLSQIGKIPKHALQQKTTSSVDKQLQNLRKRYEQLSDELKLANSQNMLLSQMSQMQKSTIESLEKQNLEFKQKLKKPANQAPIKVANTFHNFFAMKSMIETSKEEKQFLVRSIQDYCSRQIKNIEMVFKKDEANSNNFQYCFKTADLTDNICLFLMKKSASIFGIVTFPDIIKGSPSAFLISATNKKCVYKCEERNEKAFSYEINTIVFGKNEIKIKSGFKNFTVTTSFRGYFDNYIKTDIFGPQFKEVSEMEGFQIHKVHV